MACDTQGEHHFLSLASINELQHQIDPAVFFRISRSEMVNINQITRIEQHGKDTLAVYLKCLKEPLITSKTRTAEFRKWLTS
ncbi:LytTR family DNA-binding domain-containing protein [Rheinheimera sp.]|uniref:LytTR family DNA-binding domain-containing protein n=1 Tax=Rheinheimera sp. TaxID=1869214 RepID=UPI0040478C5C